MWLGAVSRLPLSIAVRTELVPMQLALIVQFKHRKRTIPLSINKSKRTLVYVTFGSFRISPFSCCLHAWYFSDI